MTIVPVYAALLGLLFTMLSIRVTRLRRELRIAVGDDGNPRMQRAIGAHINFAQYVPLALLLLAFIEIQQAPAAVIHLLCLSLLISRSLHAYGVSQVQENFRFRLASVLLTFGVLSFSALYLLGLAAHHALGN